MGELVGIEVRTPATPKRVDCTPRAPRGAARDEREIATASPAAWRWAELMASFDVAPTPAATASQQEPVPHRAAPAVSPIQNDKIQHRLIGVFDLAALHRLAACFSMPRLYVHEGCSELRAGGAVLADWLFSDTGKELVHQGIGTS